MGKRVFPAFWLPIDTEPYRCHKNGSATIPAKSRIWKKRMEGLSGVDCARTFGEERDEEPTDAPLPAAAWLAAQRHHPGQRRLRRELRHPRLCRGRGGDRQRDRE